MINGQLSVNSLTVSSTMTAYGNAEFYSQVTALNVMPPASSVIMPTIGSASDRWGGVYGNIGDFSTVYVGSFDSLFIGGAPFSDVVSVLQGNIDAVAASVATLGTRVDDLEDRVDALEARDEIGGGFVSCVGTATNSVPLVCPLPAAAGTVVSVTPVGGPSLKPVIPTAGASDVYIYGPNSAVEGYYYVSIE